MSSEFGHEMSCLFETVSEEETQRKVDPFVLDPKMMEDTVKAMNETIKEKIQVNLITITAPAATHP